MGRFKVGIQLYSLRNDMSEDFEGTLKKCKKMGYDGVEFAGLYGKTAEEVKELCEQNSLIPISAHVPYPEILKNERILDTYAEIGCKYIAIPNLLEEHRPGNERFNELIEIIKILGKKAQELGMTLCYHNHDFEFVKINGEYGLDILYKEVSKDILETELDTCWVNVGGENPSDYIIRYRDRTNIIHLKDFAGSRSENMYALIGADEDKKKELIGTFEYRPVGYGVQNFEDILNAAEQADAEWIIVEQDVPSLGKTAMECAQMSVEYLKKIN